MPDEQRSLPCILLYGSENPEACIFITSELQSKGYPIIAACAPGDTATADAIRTAGGTVMETDRGGALRAGLAYFKDNIPDLPGIVTVDMSDGYSADDIVQVADAMSANPGKLVIASRADDRAAGLFARLERLCARLAFTLVHGRKVRDPWAGLKAFPAAVVPAFMDLKGEGSRYGFAIVLNLQHKGIKALSVPVTAKYALAEGSGFWDRAGDILRILVLPLKFISASLAATGADYIVFFLLDGIILKGHWAISTTISRSTGAAVGYFLNRNIVFKNKHDNWRKELAAALKFTALAAANYGASVLIVYLLLNYLGISEFIGRPITDMLLFITSYTIQREFIFRRGNPIGK